MPGNTEQETENTHNRTLSDLLNDAALETSHTSPSSFFWTRPKHALLAFIKQTRPHNGRVLAVQSKLACERASRAGMDRGRAFFCSRRSSKPPRCSRIATGPRKTIWRTRV